MFLNFETFNAVASDDEQDSVVEQIVEETKNKETTDVLKQCSPPTQQLVFYADDLYICHQAIKLQAEALERSDIKLEMFING